MTATESRSTYQPLTRRPEATTISVKALVAKVLAGEVRVPVFQRPIRWRADDVVLLFDSIWRGYPIGSLLFWRRSADAEEIRVGGARLPVGPADAWSLVDGQQRTTALAAALSDLNHGSDARWSVHFDPETLSFKHGPTSPSRQGTDVPLSVLGDLRRLGRWIRDHNPPEALIQNIEEAQQRLLDYAIPAYVVDTEDERALRAAFARMNSTGARMRADEVFQALLGAPSSPQDRGLDLNALQQCCDIDGFGQPPRAEVLKATLAMSGADPTRRLEDLKNDQISKLIGRDDAEENLRATVRFLREDCGIPHVRLIPYPVVFVILARWFAVHRAPEPATRQMLARWLWRGVASGVHQRAEVSKMREQVSAIEGDDEQVSLDRLLAYVRSAPPASWSLGRFNLKSARSRVEVLALLTREPCDRFDPISLGALVSSGRIAREVIAPREFSPDDDRGMELGRTAANRILLDAGHTGLQSELRQWDRTSDAWALSSHLIDEAAFDALLRRDFHAFLDRRRAALEQLVQDHLTSRAGWDEPVLRPRSAYLESEE